MKSKVALLLAIGLIVSSCGQQDGTVVADAVSVAGAESEIVNEGDERPEEETDGATTVVVTVDFPEGVDLAGTVIVTLEDISYADADAVTIIAEEIPASQLVAQAYEVPLFLPLPLDGSIDVTATVHLDVDESGSVSQGDWISPEIEMVEPGSGSRVTATMVQI